MELVEHEEFLTRLAELFNKCNTTKGSVWLTHKRLTHDPNDPSGSKDKEYPCLVRAVDGRDIKFSTRVTSAQLPKFHAAYSALLRQSMPGLRKRDKKREKAKAELTAARRQKLETDVVITGAKRGKGRAKMQRKVKAAIKQQETRKLIAEKEQGKGNKKV